VTLLNLADAEIIAHVCHVCGNVLVRILANGSAHSIVLSIFNIFFAHSVLLMFVDLSSS